MNRLDRYIIAHILGLTAIVALALVAIFTFISFVGEVDDTGQGGFGMAQLMIYTALMMPTGLYTLMPIIALLGTLMGLGTLAAQGELTAMRAAGVTIARLGAATLMAGALLGVFSLVLGDWIVPTSQTAAESYRTQARSGVAAGIGGRAVWLRDGDHVFHIRRLLAEDHIAEVEIYTLTPELGLAAALRVDEGIYRDGRWQFSGVQRTQFEPARARADALDSLEWTATLSPEVLRLFVLEARSLTVPGLLRLIRYLDDNGLDSGQYHLSLWRKLVAPLTVMAMMLFAVPFVLGPQRNTGTGQRLLIGVLAGIGFYVFNEVTASLGQLYTWPGLLAAGLPTLLFAGLGLLRLAREH